MGRAPSRNRQLPARMRARHRPSGTYYYFDHGGSPRKETPLGNNYVEAMQKWASLMMSSPVVRRTIAHAISEYLASAEFARLGSGTQKDYRFAMDKLLEHFGDANLEDVKPSHVVSYLDFRSKQSQHRAQREVSVLGMIYGYAMARDWVVSNPVSPVRRKRLNGRKEIYIDDAVLHAVYEQAGEPLRDAIDLAYLIGQRPADVIGIVESQIQDGALYIHQAKTGTKVSIPVTGDLEAVIERILIRKSGMIQQTMTLLTDERGYPMTKAKLRSRFEDARAKAGEIAAHFQFRDLRSKAASDLRDQSGLEAAQTLLGHASITMTEHYTRNRTGKTAGTPTAKWKKK